MSAIEDSAMISRYLLDDVTPSRASACSSSRPTASRWPTIPSSSKDFFSPCLKFLFIPRIDERRFR